MDCELTHGSVTRVKRFIAGIAAANRACGRQFGVRFDQLPAIDAGRFLQSIFANSVDADMPLATWAHEVVNPVLVQACFAGRVYESYCNRVFWKIFAPECASCFRC